jgi:hypothetical protein
MDKVDKLLERYENAKTRKSQYDTTLSEVGKYCWPAMQDMVRTVMLEEGTVRTTDIYDSTANLAAYRMTAGIFSYLMPVGENWYQFIARESALNEDPVTQELLSSATAVTHREIWRSNFQREMFTTIRSVCVFGTGVISVESVNKDIVFRSYHLGNMFFEENSKGDVDVVFRRIFYTARQAKQEWGNNLGKSVEKELEKENSTQKFEFVHIVFPNTDYDKSKVGSKKFTGMFINIEDRHIVKETSYDTLPYLVARFSKTPNEILGRSPATELLPEIKMLNAMRKTFIESSEKQANPPLLVEDDGVIGQPATEPNGLVVVRSGALKPEYLTSGVNSALNAEVIRDQQNLIREGFFNDLFDALANYRNMTATEVIQRVEEKMVLLAPAISSLQKELLDPLITRVYELIPDEVLPKADLDLQIVYQGRLALAMSNMQANAIEATLAKWAPYMELAPVLDNINLDRAFRKSALNAGVPPEVFNDPDDVASVREGRQMKQDAAEQAEIGVNASKAIANLSKPIEPNSPVGLMI